MISIVWRMAAMEIMQAGTQFYQNSSVTYLKTLCRLTNICWSYWKCNRGPVFWTTVYVTRHSRSEPLIDFRVKKQPLLLKLHRISAVQWVYCYGWKRKDQNNYNTKLTWHRTAANVTAKMICIFCERYTVIRRLQPCNKIGNFCSLIYRLLLTASLTIKRKRLILLTCRLVHLSVFASVGRSVCPESVL